MIDIKQVLKGGVAELKYIDDGFIWYEILYPAEERGSIVRKSFMFSISALDTKGLRFERTEKALHMIQWIRQQINGGV